MPSNGKSMGTTIRNLLQLLSVIKSATSVATTEIDKKFTCKKKQKWNISK